MRSALAVAMTLQLPAGMISTLAMLRGSDAESFLDEQAEQYWCRH